MGLKSLSIPARCNIKINGWTSMLQPLTQHLRRVMAACSPLHPV